MRCEPYLFFNGRCEEAVQFYRQAVEADVRSLIRFREAPDVPAPDGFADKVLHADMRIGETTLLATDGDIGGAADFQGFSLSLTLARDAEAEKRFAALAAGGHVQVPMTATFFASRFGMVKDRFGLLWTILAHESQATAEA